MRLRWNLRHKRSHCNSQTSAEQRFTGRDSQQPAALESFAAGPGVRPAPGFVLCCRAARPPPAPDGHGAVPLRPAAAARRVRPLPAPGAACGRSPAGPPWRSPRPPGVGGWGGAGHVGRREGREVGSWSAGPPGRPAGAAGARRGHGGGCRQWDARQQRCNPPRCPPAIPRAHLVPRAARSGSAAPLPPAPCLSTSLPPACPTHSIPGPRAARS